MQQSPQTIDASNLNRNLVSVLQQEVDFGAQALKQGKADVAVTFFQSALRKMTVEMPFYDHLVHNLLLSYRQIIETLLAKGDAETARDFVRSAVSLEIKGEMADDPEFLRKFADEMHNLGLSLFQKQRVDESIVCYRKAISLYPSEQNNYVNLTNSLTVSGGPALLSDFSKELTPEQLGHHIFIACVPKSASTFIKKVLTGLTGFRELFLVYAAGQSEHEIYLPTLREFGHMNTVTQQHCRASDANVNLMQAFGIRPIVLVRNIFDSVMSLFDFYNGQRAYYNTYFRADFMSLNDETKIDLLIDNVVPWYLQFVASWDLVEKKQRLDMQWLRYEDLISDKPATISKILKFYGFGAQPEAIVSRIKNEEGETKKIRFNKGIAGRGSSGLTDLQKERIRQLTRYYPTTDFGRIGL